jgi:hypothetical protein
MKSKRISKALLIGGGILALPMAIIAIFYIFILQVQISFVTASIFIKAVYCVGLSGTASMLIGLMAHVCFSFRNKSGTLVQNAVLVESI